MHGLTESEVDRILVTVVENAIVREPDTADIVAPDKGDQHLWDLLAAVRKAALITGDRRLLENQPAGYRILSPRQFLEIGSIK